MRLHARYLAFGAAQGALALVALGTEAGLVTGALALAAPGARTLLMAGAPALALLAPEATTRLERALAALLVAASGLTVGVAFRAAALGPAAPVGDAAGAFLGVSVTILLLQRLRASGALGAGAAWARAGFLVVAVATALLGGSVSLAGGVGVIATVALAVAHLRAADARRRVSGAVAAGIAANPFVPAFLILGVGIAVDRGTRIAVDWAAVGADVALLALVTSALAPGLILAAGARWSRRGAVAP